MSHPLYEKYLSDMKRLNATPPYMTEAQVLESLGIKTEDKCKEPLIVRPKKQVVKQSLTTEKTDHFREVTKKAKQPKKPKAARKPLTADQKKIKNQKRNEKRKEERRKNPNFKQRTDLSQMTPQEIKEHRSKLQRLRNEKKKAAGWVEPPKTAAQKARQREYLKQYYQMKKNDPDFKKRRSETLKRYYERKKNDPEFMAKQAKCQAKYAEKKLTKNG